jgi:hypothetical protein
VRDTCIAHSSQVQAVVKKALSRMQLVLANIKVLLPVYRPVVGNYARLNIFALPPGQNSSAPTLSATIAELLPDAEPRQALTEFTKLQQRAGVHCDRGGTTRQAWARASEEFPELKLGRKLVERLLISRPTTGDLERTFRVMREAKPAQRARMLDTTVEDFLFAELSPPVKCLRQVVASSSRSTLDSGAKTEATSTYMERVLRLHVRLYGAKKAFTAQSRKRRRDADVPREADSSIAQRERATGPTTDADYARSRERVLQELLAADDATRAERLRSGPFGAISNIRGVAAPAAASVVAKAETRASRETARQASASAAAAKARAKVQKKVIKTSVQRARTKNQQDGPTIPAGIALGRRRDVAAFERARRLGFRCMEDPVDFVRAMAKTRSKAPGRGHLVLVPLNVQTDFVYAARLAASLVGAYVADETNFSSTNYTLVRGCCLLGG